MNKKPTFLLKRGESVVTAFSEDCAGPGWANTLTWVVIRSQAPGGGYRLRTEAIQPDEATATILTLAPHSAMLHRAMVGAIQPYLRHLRKDVA